MGLFKSLRMLGKSIFSSKEEKAAWTIQFFQIAAEKPGWSKDDIIELMQTGEATRMRKEFVKNHSLAKIEAIVKQLRARIELANEQSQDSQDSGDLTQSEYDSLMKELETDRKYWDKEETSAMAEVFSKMDALEKSLEEEPIYSRASEDIDLTASEATKSLSKKYNRQLLLRPVETIDKYFVYFDVYEGDKKLVDQAVKIDKQTLMVWEKFEGQWQIHFEVYL